VTENKFADEIESAMDAADAYMVAFNNRDQQGMADACNFPHIRIASGSVRTWKTEQDSMVPNMFEYLEKTEGWHHSKWDYRKCLHAGENKVHLDVQFTRYNKSDEPVGTYQSLWVMTLQQDGKWGIQARSSYAR